MMSIAELHHGGIEAVELIIPNVSDETRTAQRLAYHRRERLYHLAVEAGIHGVQLEQENALVWVTRVEDIPGEYDLVTDEGCTCCIFRAWHRCEHYALLLRQLERI